MREWMLPIKSNNERGRAPSNGNSEWYCGELVVRTGSEHAIKAHGDWAHDAGGNVAARLQLMFSLWLLHADGLFGSSLDCKCGLDLFAHG